MAIPNCQHIVARLAAEYPQEWQQAHRGGPQTEAFIRRLAWVLHSTVDTGFGLLGQYGDPSRIADDVIMYLGEGPGTDQGTGRPQSGFDVIAGAGGPAPRPVWNDISGSGAAIWVQPEPVGGSVGGIDPSPIEPPPPPVLDFAPVLEALRAIDSRLTGLALEVSDVKTRVFETERAATMAATEALNAASRASEIKTAVSALNRDVRVDFPFYEGRFFGQRVTLAPKG